MPGKLVRIGDEARVPMIKGMNTLANAVGATLGPGGRLAALRRSFGPVMITKDGVTVAEEVELSDPLEDAGAKLCRQVARKCNELAGDGTTTATVLAQALIQEGQKRIATGSNPVQIKKGIDKAVSAVVDYLNSVKKPITLSDVDQVKFIATISGNDIEVGESVSEAFIKAGTNGVVSFEEGKTINTVVEVVEGTQFDKGFTHPHFVTDQERNQCILDNPLILLWENRISSLPEIMKLLEKVTACRENGIQRPLLIIADSVEGDALATVIINHIKGVLPACIITPPAFGEQRQLIMQDIACLIGGQYFDTASGCRLDQVTTDQLGKAKKVVVTNNSTTIIGGEGGESDKFKERISSLQSQLEATDSKYDADKLKQRIAKLSGGVAVIKIGAQNETDMREKKFRVEDAVFATRAALSEGIVAGGGTALLGASLALQDLQGDSPNENDGISVVLSALRVPLQKIASNAGYNSKIVIDDLTKDVELLKAGYGFNASTGKYENLLETGVVDPVKVGRLALQNAATIAGLFLLSEAVIVDDPDAKEPQHMGGMM